MGYDMLEVFVLLIRLSVYVDPHQVPIAAAHLYDAVMVYAQALNATLSEGGDPRNGTRILSKIRGQTFQSIQGFKVTVAEHDQLA